MAIVTDLIDRLRELQADRMIWESHWNDMVRYTLPDAERFDQFFASHNIAGAMDAVVGEPAAARRTREVYDMTSLWAIDRGAAGLISLITPQTGTWHDMASDDPFAVDPDDNEQRWYETVRDYLFNVRGNPVSGFWVAHKAAIRSTWALGTAVTFVEQGKPDLSAPIGYRHVPLSQCFMAADFNGLVDTNYRVFRLSARQCVQKFGQDKVSAKTAGKADDPKKKDEAVLILHAVQPRQEMGSAAGGARDAGYGSYYVEIDNKHLIGDSGFYQFPFRVDHWQKNTPGPYAEGPVAMCLAEIKSLNVLSKSMLRAAQQHTDPPMGMPNDGLPRLNLNPRGMNPGAVNSQGQLLVQPLITAQRPDFAEVVRTASREQVQNALYVKLWQTLVEPAPGETATAALIRNQEKGDLLGPVGTSLQTGLAQMVDREIGILSRRDAFAPGSPLEAPQSVQGKGVGVRFTSPLDKLRRLSEFQGMQQLWAFAAELAKGGILDAIDKLDADESMDFAQEVLNAPRRVMATDQAVQGKRQARHQQTQVATGIGAAQGIGDAAQSGVAAVDAASKSPASQEIIKRLMGVAQSAAQQRQQPAPAGQ